MLVSAVLCQNPVGAAGPLKIQPQPNSFVLRAAFPALCVWQQTPALSAAEITERDGRGDSTQQIMSHSHEKWY